LLGTRNDTKENRDELKDMFVWRVEACRTQSARKIDGKGRSMTRRCDYREKKGRIQWTPVGVEGKL